MDKDVFSLEEKEKKEEKQINYLRQETDHNTLAHTTS